MALSLQRYTSDYRGDSLAPLNQLLRQRVRNEGKRSSRAVVVSVMNWERLPENVLVEILSWLPVRDVLQYKSVCKSWYALISSPLFISKHLNNNRNYNPNCMLAAYYVSNAELQLHELFVDETPRVLEYEVLYNLPSYGYGAFFYGPCDGLYYLCANDFRAFWNPTINELTTLPPIIPNPNPPPNSVYCSLENYAFGLDPLTRDYKVVVIKSYFPANDDVIPNYPLSVLVYSLRTDSWKYCGDLARGYSLKNNTCYIVAEGCCFWLGSSHYSDVIYRELIISFDMACDSFQEIPVPNYHRFNYDSRWSASNRLGMYEDSLAFFSVHKDEVDGILDTWTFDQGIWTKKFTMGPFIGLRNPVGHWHNNKVILEYWSNKLVMYDPNTQKLKDLAFKGGHQCEGIFEHMESLVSIKDKIKVHES
ncbi:hypothetical protein vseg_018028 [Gypsophila vaccaria]